MRYSIWLLSFVRKFGDKYGKKLMDTETKTGIDAAKITSKRLVQKLAESTRDLNGNKKADKITSAGKAKSEEKEDETNKRQEIYIPSGTKQQKVGDFRLFKI